MRLPWARTSRTAASTNVSGGEAVSMPPQLYVELEEYRALRAELLTRIEKQQEITGFAIGLLAALFAVSQFIEPDESFTSTARELIWAFPIASIVLSAFTLLKLEYELNIAHILVYLDTTLRPRIVRTLHEHGAGNSADAVLRWNMLRAEWQQHAGWKTLLTSAMAGAKYAATILPNAALMWFYVQNVSQSVVFSRDGIPFWLAVVAVFLVFACATYTSTVYLRMAHVKPPPAREARPLP